VNGDPSQPNETVPVGSWRATLESLGIRPSKGLGQNFLVERGIVQRMVKAAKIQTTDLVVEVGPGLGILTRELVEHARQVVSIELDRRLAAYLEEELKASGAAIVAGDALTVDLDTLIPTDETYKLVANLPYSVGTAVVRRFIEADHPPVLSAVMVQREVAERMAASPPEMSLLSVSVQVYTEPQIAFVVPPTVFIPRPKVESAVVLLRQLETPRIEHAERELFFKIVTGGFQQRRKQLANSLANNFVIPKARVEDWLREAEIDPSIRPERLTVDDWIRICRTRPPAIA
jgi:16S rRNA (adenine1518-N6/adenine1519-N6)-dimethyltransferase